MLPRGSAAIDGKCMKTRGGVDLNHRPLGYEAKKIRNFNNLQDAGGYLKPCKERLGTAIGQLKDRRAFELRKVLRFVLQLRNTEPSLSRC